MKPRSGHTHRERESASAAYRDQNPNRVVHPNKEADEEEKTADGLVLEALHHKGQ